MAKNTQFLFEVSWEVCNKVGGIHTVLSSKMKACVGHFSENYCLIGPKLAEEQPEFIPGAFPDFWQGALNLLKEKNIHFHTGYWNIPDKPKVILLEDFTQYYDMSVLLHEYWEDYKVNSLTGGHDYQEPVSFASLAGEVIAIIHSHLLKAEFTMTLAHFHEWMCGAGILRLKQQSPEVATIFTTHATVLGRALSNTGFDIYHIHDSDFDADQYARDYHVEAKHSMESASACHADCFTTVSHITSDECTRLLGMTPNFVTVNGINATRLRKIADTSNQKQRKTQLITLAEQVKERRFHEEHTRLFVTSGRYEYKNKGYDLLLQSLLSLAKHRESASPVIVYFLIAAEKHSHASSRFDADAYEKMKRMKVDRLLLHSISDYHHDPIVNFYLEHQAQLEANHIYLIFSNAYLDGDDGIFNQPYYALISAFDAGFFPSYYEPWGYTPHEALALGIPTVTADTAGFGDWLKEIDEAPPVAKVIARKNRRFKKSIQLLHHEINELSHRHIDDRKPECYRIAKRSDWQVFYANYLHAYTFAAELTRYASKHGQKISREVEIIENSCPKFHNFNYLPRLPKSIQLLDRLAGNLWWTWQPEAKLLFEMIAPDMWQKAQNPIKLLRQVSQKHLQTLAEDPEFCALYAKVTKKFKSMLTDQPSQHALINNNTPIAYFCLEYGLHQSLPIYSGGLGVLAGDHLKTASDLHIPLIAIGLLYAKGYFHQKVSPNGEQIAQFDFHRPEYLPIKRMVDTNNLPVQICLDLNDRHLYLNIWEVKVGNVNLYLLDSNTDKNRPQDQKITEKLYDGDREVRFLQEMVLGIAGVRLIEEVLKLKPALYHMNEGHSSLLVIERMRYALKQGLKPEEARLLVKATNVFTTHTPVPAGNEVFDLDMVDKHLKPYVREIGIDYDKLIHFSSQSLGPDQQVFSMTRLAIYASAKINAVSRLHGKIAREMWQNLWPTLIEEDIPIGYVTNGAHIKTWASATIQNCLYENDNLTPKRIEKIEDAKLWEIRQKQKAKLLKYLKPKIVAQYTNRGESASLIYQTIAALEKDVLIIGFARRLAMYKRHTLLFEAAKRLEKILTNAEKPVILIFAGKAHPSDTEGQLQLKTLFSHIRKPEFKGHIIFIEDYNMELAGELVQGVDIWLNNPIVPNEACGTSGMKASFNGAMNLSTLDGWWAEAYHEKIGWQILSHNEFDITQRNSIECMLTLNQLEYEIIPLFFERKREAPPKRWLNMSKASIFEVCEQFSSERMLKEYYHHYYLPVAEHTERLMKKNALQNYSNWCKHIAERFQSCKCHQLIVEGITPDGIANDTHLSIAVDVFPGQLAGEEIHAELLLRQNRDDREHDVLIKRCRLSLQDLNDKLIKFSGKVHLETGGAYSYAVRIFPSHPLQNFTLETGLCKWL